MITHNGYRLILLLFQYRHCWLLNSCIASWTRSKTTSMNARMRQSRNITSLCMRYVLVASGAICEISIGTSRAWSGTVSSWIIPSLFSYWTKCWTMDSRWPPNRTFCKNWSSRRISCVPSPIRLLEKRSKALISQSILHFPKTRSVCLIRYHEKPEATPNARVCSFSLSETLPTGQLSNIPWRRSGVKYTTNEAYFDVIEEIDAIIDKSGSTVSAEITGYVSFLSFWLWRLSNEDLTSFQVDCCIKLTGMPDLTLTFMNPRLLDDVSFHPCVRFKRWEVGRDRWASVGLATHPPFFSERTRSIVRPTRR